MISPSPVIKQRVAVAGVTKGVGYSIASALLDDPSQSVTLLTRPKVGPEPIIEEFLAKGAVVHHVDYDSIPDLTAALTGVHTVISTVWLSDNVMPMMNVVKAAVAAGVKRFAPSEFSLSAAVNVDLDLYHTKVEVWKEVQNSGFEEYTAFRNGLFMNYLAAGAPVVYKGPIEIYPYIVDVAKREAEIPGTGDEPMTLTTAEDVGKFVAAAIHLDSWPKEMGMGHTTTWNRIVAEAEEVLGEKFSVRYVSKEELKKRVQVEGEKGNWLGKLQAGGLLVISEGKAEVGSYLNRATNVRATSTRSFLEAYWGKK